MDFNSLKDQVSNLTLYDVKAGVRKIQAAVMNYTEMEQKVREATNNEPWGASSTLMQEISNGTHSYQLLNEIMPMIYKRFTDKTAEEWRQIYKALQLLEFLIKNGSERVIDDARSHLSLLRMLRQFHYVDQNGKDQGINVRNRAQELAKLLNDVDAIRAERKKARANRNKFGGVEGGSGLGGGLSSGSRYGGFGSEDASYGHYTGRVYGDGGGFGGQETSFADAQRGSDKFEEYDEGDDGGSSRNPEPARRAASVNTIKRDAAKAARAKAEPEVDLFDFTDEPVSISNGKTAAQDDFGTLESSSAANGDDEFDDFQTAETPAAAPAAPLSGLSVLSPPPATTSTTTSTTQFAAPKPVSGTQSSSFNDLFSTKSPGPTSSSGIASVTSPQTTGLASPATQPMKPQTFSSGPNYFTSVPSQTTPTPASNPRPNVPTSVQQPSYSSSTSASTLGKPTPKSTTSGGDAFSSLWSTASTTAGINRSNTSSKGPDLASMAKAKSSAGIWGATPSGSTPANQSRPLAPTPNIASAGQTGSTTSGSTSLGNGLDDLLG
ncbi:putative golgi to endosome transporter [Phaeomoniella chlamydospora]|uniref:Putative golgi to endosome transporter n=1 Tax=Phaeomoniella chlamydospora TaxID=158046 RepID=A0A0G2EAD6_PHACM|nr:putative golgi to endosome transporter [Phaeomoniella chlamydospora]